MDDNDEELRVTGKDCQQAGFCGVGLRRWAAVNKVELRAFLKDGLPVSEVEAFGDALALRAVAVARKRSG